MRGGHEPLRLEVARALYGEAEDGGVYAWSRLAEVAMKCGLSNGHAMLLIWDFHLLGLLERLKTGLYKVKRG